MKSSTFALRVGTTLCAAVLVGLVAQPIFAQKAFLKKVKELYPDLDKKSANCALCHATTRKRKSIPTRRTSTPSARSLHDQPAMKTVIDQKDGDEHKFTDEELKNVETALKALFPDKAALEKAIAEKK